MNFPHRFRRRSRPFAPFKARGFTLVELMISMVLGLVVLASASAIFLSNRQTYRATETLGRLQESGRMSFELMARDVRQAAGNPCAKDLPVANVINNPTAQWWSNWATPVIGYGGGNATSGLPFGTAPGNRIAGTDAIELKSADNISGLTVVSDNPASAQIKLNTVSHTLTDFDIVMVCDYRQAAIFQITNAQPGINDTIAHNNGTGTPGNCSKGLGYPTNCGSATGTPYTYGADSVIVRLQASRWYIGRNGTNTGSSLYRSIMANNGGVITAVNQEIVPDVDDMQLQYLVRNAADYVNANAVVPAQWANVIAVRVQLNMAGTDRIGTDGAVIQRQLEHTITLRNRMQ